MELMARDRDRTWNDEHILVPGELAYVMVVRDSEGAVLETEISTNKRKLEHRAGDHRPVDPTRTAEIFEAYLR